MNEKDFRSAAARWYQSIYNYCLVRLRDSSAAGDCTQEVFLAMYRKLDTLQDGNIRGWLYRTADNLIKNYRKSDPPHLSTDDAQVQTMQTFDTYDVEAPFDGLFSEGELAMLREHYIEGFPIAEVALKHGVSVDSVYKKFQRMKNKLQKMQGGNGNG